MKIFIDPGHGGSSVGAAYKGRKEQDDVLRLSLAIKERLSLYKDIEVLLSREADRNITIAERAAQANAWKADYFISVHRNAFSPNKAKGAEVWCYSGISTVGGTYEKAEYILNKLCENTGFVNRGVKLGAPSYADFGVNRLTRMSSCLLEAGFIDSDEDNRIFDEKFEDMVNALADGLLFAVGYEKEPIKGDVDNDGAITSSDARLILRASVGLEEIPVEQADMDNDGKITASDAREALRIATGQEGSSDGDK